MYDQRHKPVAQDTLAGLLYLCFGLVHRLGMFFPVKGFDDVLGSLKKTDSDSGE